MSKLLKKIENFLWDLWRYTYICSGIEEIEENEREES